MAVILDQKDYTKVLKGSSRYFQNHNPIIDTGRIMYDVPPVVPKLPRTGSEYYVVSDVHQDRVDLVARMRYQTDKNYWLLAGVNRIDVPFYIERDMTLQLPPMTEFITRGVVQG